MQFLKWTAEIKEEIVIYSQKWLKSHAKISINFINKEFFNNLFLNETFFYQNLKKAMNFFIWLYFCFLFHCSSFVVLRILNSFKTKEICILTHISAIASP